MFTKFKLVLLVAMLLLSFVFAPASHALPLTARDTTMNPADGFPVWYQDSNGLSLGQCLDSIALCGLLADATFTGVLPVVFPTNYPGEQFYFLAEVLMGPPYNLLYVAATEGSFAGVGNPANGLQAVFSRVRIRADITLPGTYTVTHPYGTETFVVDTPGRRAINFSNDVQGLVALSFDGPLGIGGPPPFVGPYLRASAAPGGVALPFVEDVATGGKYLANPGAPTAVTGAPTGNNSVSITGPDGTVTETLFTLVGKVVGNDVTPKSLVFPTQRPGTVDVPVLSTAQTVTVTNISRTTPLTVTVAIDGANAGDFVITADGCSGVPIPASTATVPGTCTFGVQFGSTAPTPAARTASVLITTTDPVGLPPMRVALSGTIDSVPPTITLKVPENGETIPANSSIFVIFSEPMDPATINATNFTLTSDGAIVTASTVTFDAANNTATFVPLSQLLPVGATNVATITTGVTDVAGNGLVSAVTWTFATVDADFIAPTVVSTSPARGALGVPLNAPIRVTFNDGTGRMNPLSINAGTITVSGGVTPASVTFDAATTTATFTPSVPLAAGTAYTVTVKGGAGGVEDWAQNTLVSDFQFTFISNNPPSHPLLISPDDGSAGLPAASVTLTWAKSTDDDGDALEYHLELCQNRFFIGCEHELVPVTASAPRLNGAYFAGLGGLGMAVVGLVSFGGLKGRKKFLALMIVVLLLSGTVIAACSGSDKTTTVNVPSSAEVSFTKTGLLPGAVYFWRVEVHDPNGGADFSETRSFRTQ